MSKHGKKVLPAPPPDNPESNRGAARASWADVLAGCFSSAARAMLDCIPSDERICCGVLVVSCTMPTGDIHLFSQLIKHEQPVTPIYGLQFLGQALTNHRACTHEIEWRARDIAGVGVNAAVEAFHGLSQLME